VSRTRFLLILLGASVLGLAGFYGRFVPFSKQWPLYEGLRTTAAIIFAVVGAWLAIAYPERLKVSLGKLPTSAKQESPLRIPVLMTPIAHSTGVLASVLAIGLLAPLIAQLPLVQSNLECARGLSYAILAGLTMWQIWTVISTLAPASAVKDNAVGESAKNKHVNAVIGRARKARKKE